MIDVTSQELPGSPVTYQFQFKKKVHTADVFDFTLYSDNTDYQWVFNQDIGGVQVQDNVASNPQGEGSSPIDKVDDDLPTGEYRNDPDSEVEPLDWVELNNSGTLVYVAQGQNAGVTYQLIAINYEAAKKGWVAVGSGKINGSIPPLPIFPIRPVPRRRRRLPQAQWL